MSNLLLHDVKPLQTKGPKVIVVGAGLAGLATAVELERLGFDVRVFEARGRVGGRVESIHWEGSRWVEAGAELIGRNHRRWLQYAERFGLVLDPIETYIGPFSPIIRRDSIGSAHRAAELFSIIRDVEERFTEAAGEINLDAPWESPNAELYDTMSVEDFLLELDVIPDALKILQVQLMANQGLPADRISLLGFLTLIAAHGGAEYWTHTENFRCAQGSQALAERLAECLKRRVTLDAPVREVHATAKRVAVALSASETIYGDEVVLTVPPNLWCDGTIKVRPTIEGVAPQMGDNVKVMIRLSSGCDIPEGLNGLAISTRRLLQVLWCSIRGQGAEDTALVAYLGGARARSFLNIPREDRLRRCKEELELLVPGIGAHVLSVSVYPWPTEAWSRTAYSCPAPGDVIQKWPSLRTPIGRLSIAGEATSNYWGFMEGALDSAERVARALVAKYST